MLASGNAGTTDALRKERLAREHRKRLAQLPLMEFVPRVSPELVAPKHLAPLVDLFESATRGDVRAVSSVPPQHGKSVTLFHLLVRELLRNPRKRFGYGTYSIEFAQSQSIKALQIARRALLPLERETMSEWVTPQGGGIVWVGVGGQLTGLPIDGVFVADDLVKSRADAESKAVQRAAMNFLTSTVMTRLHPGASLILNATRWTPDDPSGQMIRAGWPNVNLPAVNDAGEALWPEQRPLDFLERQRADIGEYDWWSLYQGSPRPRGGAVFQDAWYYDELPPDPFREAIGIDFAYTAKSHADYSVAVRGRAIGDTLYLTHVYRAQVEMPAFAAHLKAQGQVRMLARIGGTEKGVVDFLRRDYALKIDTIPATTDKHAFAQPLAASWNTGRVLLPRNAPWVPTLLDEVLSFTGVNDAHDDIVDALGALHHALFIKTKADLASVRRASGL
jgi:predicted phage terminase large subunit-like protein